MISNGYFMNISPMPATGMGIVRFVVQLDGEKIVEINPFVGFSHREIEKCMEENNILGGLIFSEKVFIDGMFQSQYPYILACEKLLGLKVPKAIQDIRVFLIELTRIKVHLRIISNIATDTGIIVVSPLVSKMISRIKGTIHKVIQSPAVSFFRPGGIANNIHSDAKKICMNLLSEISLFTQEMRQLIDNSIFKSRTTGKGVLSAEDVFNYGITGVNARASGVKIDVRKDNPYESYGEYNFDIPIKRNGDCYSRFLLRFDEIYQSICLIKEIFEKFSNESTITQSKKYDLDELKLPSESFYQPTESSLGELGCFLVGNNTEKPYRCHFKSNGGALLQSLNKICVGCDLTDFRSIVSSLGIVMTEVDR